MDNTSIMVVVILSYILVMVVLSARAAKKNAAKKTVSEFTTASGTMGWLIIASAMFGTCTSSAATIGAANTFYNMGWTGIHYGISRALPFILMGFVGIEKIRHFKYTNPGDMFAVVFKKKDDYIYGIMFSFVLIGLCGSCILGSVSVIKMFFPEMSKWAAAAIVAVVFWLMAFFGGMRGANNTGLINSIVIVIGMLVCAVLGVNHAGGFNAISAKLAGTNMSSLFAGQSIKVTIAWYLASIVESWAAANVWLQINAAKTDRDVKLGFSMSGVVALVVAFIVGFIGLAAYVIYPELPPSGALLSVAEGCGPVIAAIMAVALIAAVASTAVQFYVAAPTVLYSSVAAISGKELSEEGKYKLLKSLTAVVGVLGFLIAIFASDLITLATTIITINTPYAVLIICCLACPQILKKSTFRVVSLFTLITLLCYMFVPAFTGLFSHAIYPVIIEMVIAILLCYIFDKNEATVNLALKDEYIRKEC